jgi:hypothetical protein
LARLLARGLPAANFFQKLIDTAAFRAWPLTALPVSASLTLIGAPFRFLRAAKNTRQHGYYDRDNYGQ